MDLDDTFTERAALAAQYGDAGNYEARRSLYACIDSPYEAMSFPEWVVDRIAWTGEETVLDVGSGPGLYLEPLLARAGRVVAIDLSAGMVRRVVEQMPRRRCAAAAADAQRLPLRDASIDVIVAAHMLYHLPDLGTAVREFRRVLRPGGVVLAAANGADDKRELLALWSEAAEEVTGGRVRAPEWGRRFNIDIGPSLLQPSFSLVGEHRRTGIFRIPGPEPVVTWMESLRPGTESVMSDAEWQAVVDGVSRRIEAAVAADGAFLATQVSGVLVAR